MSYESLDEPRLRRLIEVGCSLVANLDLESLLDQIVEAARDLTGARYGALGILNEQGNQLDRLVVAGIDDEQRAQIGRLPRGEGVLGLLIEDPRPLRLSKASDHDVLNQFPPHHPSIDNFLGVPILIHGEVFGDLYLADKSTGEFDESDESSVVTLAIWAAIAIENA